MAAWHPRGERECARVSARFAMALRVRRVSLPGVLCSQLRRRRRSTALLCCGDGSGDARECATPSRAQTHTYTRARVWTHLQTLDRATTRSHSHVRIPAPHTKLDAHADHTTKHANSRIHTFIAPAHSQTHHRVKRRHAAAGGPARSRRCRATVRPALTRPHGVCIFYVYLCRCMCVCVQ